MKTLTVFLSLFVFSAFAGDTWHQAAGPNADWKVEGEAPIQWSATRNENILWRTPMPEAGMSAVTIWKDKAFVTTHKPLESIEKSNQPPIWYDKLFLLHRKKRPQFVRPIQYGR